MAGRYWIVFKHGDPKLYVGGRVDENGHYVDGELAADGHVAVTAYLRTLPRNEVDRRRASTVAAVSALDAEPEPRRRRRTRYQDGNYENSVWR